MLMLLKYASRKKKSRSRGSLQSLCEEIHCLSCFAEALTLDFFDGGGAGGNRPESGAAGSKEQQEAKKQSDQQLKRSKFAAHSCPVLSHKNVLVTSATQTEALNHSAGRGLTLTTQQRPDSANTNTSSSTSGVEVENSSGSSRSDSSHSRKEHKTVKIVETLCQSPTTPGLTRARSSSFKAAIERGQSEESANSLELEAYSTPSPTSPEFPGVPDINLNTKDGRLDYYQDHCVPDYIVNFSFSSSDYSPRNLGSALSSASETCVDIPYTPHQHHHHHPREHKFSELQHSKDYSSYSSPHSSFEEQYGNNSAAHSTSSASSSSRKDTSYVYTPKLSAAAGEPTQQQQQQQANLPPWTPARSEYYEENSNFQTNSTPITNSSEGNLNDAVAMTTADTG